MKKPRNSPGLSTLLLDLRWYVSAALVAAADDAGAERSILFELEQVRQRSEGIRRRRARPNPLLVRIRIGRGARVVADACEVGIGNAGQLAARRGRLTLRIGIVGAVAQARIFLALQAEGVPNPDGVSR